MYRNHRDRLSCWHIAHRLQLYIDGEAGTSTRTRVAEHLAECQHCARLAALYGAIKNTLAQDRDTDEAAIRRLDEFTRRIAATDEAPPPP